MIACSICETPNPSTGLFCIRCGVSLASPPSLARPPLWPDYRVHDGYLFDELLPAPQEEAPPEPPTALFAVASTNPLQRFRTPVVTAGMLLLLFASVLVLIALVQPWTIPSRAAIEPGNGIAGGQPGSVEQVIAAIDAANEAQVRALRNANADLLIDKMTGQVLDENKQAIRQLRATNSYQVAELIDIQYQPVVFHGEDNATVNTTEIWKSSVYSSDGQLQGERGPETLHEVYHVTRVNGYWLVERIDITAAP